MNICKRYSKMWFLLILIVAFMAGCSDSNNNGGIGDTTAPTVSFTSPPNSDTAAAVNQQINVAFSEAVDPATINTATFTVTGPGATPVTGTVDHIATNATFTPASPFASSTLYTAVVTTGVKDMSGNALARNFVWSFTTDIADDITAPTVSFTSSTNGSTAVPINQQINVAFSEAMYPKTINTATFMVRAPGGIPVTGTIDYVGTTATFTPTSPLASSTLYTATVTPGAKDLSGNALASNFVWSFTTDIAEDKTAPTVSFTSPTNGATAADMNRQISVAFSEAMYPATITTATFTVRGPGGTPIAGTVNYVGSTATFTPANDLVSSTLYTATVTTGAKDLSGNALASNFVWSFTTGTAADTSTPTVSFTSPANGSTAAAVNQQIDVAFSEAMYPATITTATFLVSGPGGTHIAGTVDHVGTTATFTPANPLAFSTLYTAMVTTGVRDLAGNALASNFVWSFTTGPAADTTAPTVSFTSSANGSTAVPINRQINIAFNEAMSPSTITTATFLVSGPGGTLIPGTVDHVGTTATFTPANPLEFSTLYTAMVTTGVRDLAGNALASNFVWSFTTGTAADTTAPTVSFTSPADDATVVPVNRQINVAFSEAMYPATITTATFLLSGPGGTVLAGTVDHVGTTATFTPASPLAFSTLYTAMVTTRARDLAGNALENTFVWSFTTGTAADTTAPTVSFTSPTDDATAVPINRQISVAFSETMSPATITTTTFTVRGPGATPVTGTIAYVGTTAIFTPASNLTSSTLYTATVSTGARDLAGNALASNFVWNFTTGTAADTTAPTVSFTSPANGATSVAVFQHISVAFSEAMSPATITTETFLLSGPGATHVTGTVAYVGTTATFTPAGTLASSTLYTAMVTTGARDLAGNAMASNSVWSFTTGTPADTTAPTVSFTSPTDGATAVPINQQVSVAFSEAMSPATITTATFLLSGPGATPVTGTVAYVGTTATFTPAGNLASSTLYTATVATGARDLAGNALTSDFVWGFTTGIAADTTAPTVSFTSPTDDATAVGINQQISVAFSEAMNPATITSATFTMRGPGATPVTGTVAYVGTTATFAPTDPLASSTLYTVTVATGARDLAGNALASDFVWIFTTGIAADTTSPTVSFTSPTNGATAVGINQQISVAFSEAMSPATITSATFTVRGPGATLVTGTVAYVGTTAIFIPANPLASSTLYISIVTTGARDLAGNAMASNFVWSFTTGPTADTTAPTVSFTSPTNDATAVPINRQINVAFSEAMNPATITTATITVRGPGGTPVAGTVDYVGTTATFTPTGNLAFSTLYTATVTTGARDLAGNAMASNFVWSFTTGTAADTTAPMVSFTSPANGATTVGINQQISVAFSEAMSPATITTATFLVSGPGVTPVTGTVAYVGTNATFTATGNLASSTLYTAMVTTGARDLAGNAMENNFVWSFTTGTAADTTAPTVSFTSPTDGSTAVPINRQVSVAFSEAMNPATITTATVTVTGPGGTPVTGTIAYVGTNATFTPTGNFASSTLYTGTVATGARDLAGNALASNFVWSFTTGTAADTTAPTVSFTSPAAGTTAVPINRQINVAFSEAMNPATITTATLTLTGPGVTLVTGTVAYIGTTATFTPANPLVSSTLYTGTVATGARDLAGNAMASNFVWSFTSGTAADTTAPTVSFTSPTDGATAVPINRQINVAFSEAMNPATITTATLMLTGPGATSVTGTVAYVGTNATFTATGNLASSTLYTGTVATGARDLAGNALENNFVWSFTTGTAADTMAPTVSFTSPMNGATAVGVNQQIYVAFSEAMNPATITTATFLLSDPGANPVMGTIAYVGTNATFTPTSSLASSTLYTGTVTTGARDLAGNALASNFVWSFTTSPTADTTAPTLISTDAFDGETGLPVNRKSTATFSEPMDPATLASPATSFTVNEFVSGNSIAGVVTYIGNTATFNPDSDFLPNTKYTSTITTEAKDLAGNALTSGLIANPWSWTTGPAPDTSAPTVTITNPADLETDVPVGKKINATFSEDMSQATMITANFTVKETVSGNDVPGTVAYDGQNYIATFLPLTDLTPDTDYTATVTNGATDLAGNALVSGLIANPWTFKTAAASVPVVPLAVNLRGIASFGIASRAGLTSTGITVVNGDIALYPLTVCIDSTGNAGASQTCLVKTYSSPTGMTVNGSIYWAGDPYDNGGTANSVTNDLNIAWTEGMNKADTIGAIAANEIGGKILFPGVYHNATLGLAAAGVATFDAQNDANAIFIFKVDSSFVDSGTLTLPSRIDLINGAQARNVWFVTGLDVTIGSGTIWNGNILAGRTVTINDNSTVNGRVLGGASGAGAITLTGAAAPSVTTITVPQ